MSRFVALCLLGLSLLALPLAAQAQTRADVDGDDSSAPAPDPTADGVENRLEALGEQEGDEATEGLETLTAWLRHPLDVNRATVADLALVPGIGPDLAPLIVAERESAGPFRDLLTDLRRVRGLTRARIDLARPYLRIALGQLDRWAEARSRTVTDRPTRAGYDRPDSVASRYLGSPLRLYNRFRVGVGSRYEAGVTVEKDPGEARLTDFVGGYAVGRDGSGRVRGLIGDYTLEFGQGLAFWRSTTGGKGAEIALPARRLGRGIVPYRSADGQGFLRGAAGALALPGQIDLIGFVSERRRDGTVSSLDDAGLHRTPTEDGRRGAIRERLLGGRLARRVALGSSDRAELGLVAAHYGYDQALDPALRPDTRNAFRGPGLLLTSASADARLRGGSLSIFGEAARSQPDSGAGGLAAVGGVLVVPVPTLALVAVARAYGDAYAGPHSAGFGERDGTRNERGLYLGLDARLAPRWTLAVYADAYRFPAPTFGLPVAASGYDGLAELVGLPIRGLELRLRLRGERRDGSSGLVAADSLGRLYAGVAPEDRSNLRLEATGTPGRTVRLRARWEGVRARPSTAAATAPVQVGTLLFAEMRWQPRRSLSLEGRLTVFDTDGYDARLYAVERDLPGALTTPAVYGRGRRWYAVLRFSPRPAVSLSARVAGQTRLDLPETLAVTPDGYRYRVTQGSGLDAFSGASSHRVGVQLDLAL